MMAKAITRTAISKKKRSNFLTALARTGQVTVSAQAAGFTSPAYLHQLRRDDELFAEEWAEAIELAKYALEDLARMRVTEGIMEPVYYKGHIVGEHPKYNDQLLMFILRKLDPTYRDTGQRGDLNIHFGIAVLPMTATNEDDWENRAVEMHSGQKVIELEAKVVENRMIKTVKRGD